MGDIVAIGSFRDLCEGFCDIAAVQPPELEVDNDGLIAFHVVLRGVTINVVHAPKRSADHAFVLVECGAPPGSDPSIALLSLLDANFFTLQVHPPTFGRNPVTGEAVLQFVYPFCDASPTALYELIDRGIEFALQWQQGDSLGSDGLPIQAAAPHQHSMFASFA